jgi:hypothetical protein
VTHVLLPTFLAAGSGSKLQQLTLAQERAESLGRELSVLDHSNLLLVAPLRRAQATE